MNAEKEWRWNDQRTGMRKVVMCRRKIETRHESSFVEDIVGEGRELKEVVDAGKVKKDHQRNTTRSRKRCLQTHMCSSLPGGGR